MTVLAPLPVATPEAEQRPSWPALSLNVLSARRAPSLALHCLLAWPLILLPSAALSGLAHGLALLLDVDVTGFAPPDREASFKDFFLALIFAPLAETLLLSGLLWLLGILSKRPLFIAAAASVLWGAVHGAQGLMWFLPASWAFYVLSCSYLAWRPLGFGKAFVVAALPHALVNLTAMTLIAFAPAS